MALAFVLRMVPTVCPYERRQGLTAAPFKNVTDCSCSEVYLDRVAGTRQHEREMVRLLTAMGRTGTVSPVSLYARSNEPPGASGN